MMCTARAAMSAGPTTRRMGSVARSWSRRASRSSPSSEADSGVSTKPAAMRLTRIGATSTARLAIKAGSAAVPAAMSDRPGPRRRPPVPPMKISVPPGRTRPDSMLGDGNGQPQMLVEIAVCPLAVEIGQARVVWTAGRDHHMVDPLREVLEKPIESDRVCGVEGCAAQGTEFGRGPLEAFGIAAGQDDIGAPGVSSSSRLQPDACGADDHDDDLPG